MTADSDDDNDGVEDTSDAFPLDATETADSDAMMVLEITQMLFPMMRLSL